MSGALPSGSWVIVAGGSGFIGSHLCEALIARGHRVLDIDDHSTGRRANVSHLAASESLVVLETDVLTDDLASRVAAVIGDEEVAAVVHLASAASPPAYLARPIETLSVGSAGTERLIAVALERGARFLLASTSEVYGDPLEHPQTEAYWGNVNPIGERSVYDEAKRFAEALTTAHERVSGLDARIVRIFNTYGPRMQADDGRVVTNFVHQALRGEPLTVYGDGSQTRSFCYVGDLVAGLVALLESEVRGPVNLGNPTEFTMLELAEAVGELLGLEPAIEFRPLPSDDPRVRCPDITRARELLGWEPKVALRDGLRLMVDSLAAG
ncbi:MAG: NAD-dependent epimerase/dehydratase family protein [Ilumatobacteraceae bacterium]